METKETVVLSVGGSLVAPKDVSLSYLKKLAVFIRRNSGKYRFVLVVGGGGIARDYVSAARDLGVSKNADLDWVGIYAARLNARLVRSSLGDLAYAEIITDPTRKIATVKPVLVASGYRPGSSTDYVAVRLAQLMKISKVINLTNTTYVYDRDPKKYKTAKALTYVSWQQFKKLVGSKWRPGLNMPFDPIASKLAAAKKMQVVVCDGSNLANLQKILDGKPFKGSVIS